MPGHLPPDDELALLQEAFSKIKAENDRFLIEITDHTFVPTHVYSEIQKSGKCLIVGGKGQGKTALLIGHGYIHKKTYLSDRYIVIDDLPLKELFEFFYTDYNELLEKTKAVRKKELDSLVDPVRVASYAWKNAISTFAIYQTSKDILEKYSVTKAEYEALSKAIMWVDKISGDESISDVFIGKDQAAPVVFGLLVYFFRILQDLLDTAIGIESKDLAVVLATITRLLMSKLNSPLDPELDRAAEVIGVILKKHSKRSLISIDRIDDYFDNFIKNIKDTYSTEDNEKIGDKRQFLLSVLEGLILASRDIKREVNLKWLDNLYTIPKDKFLELKLRERAQIEQEHLVSLRWNPRELFRFVNQRIAYALKLPDTKLNDAWKLLFPFSVSNGQLKTTKEDSFLYLARHSLWKPREIQMYLCEIFGRMERHGIPADAEMFRDTVKHVSTNIIRTEFLEEFSSQYPGIRKLFLKIENADIETEIIYEDLCDYISGTELAPDIDSPDKIIRALYHMQACRRTRYRFWSSMPKIDSVQRQPLWPRTSPSLSTLVLR